MENVTITKYDFLKVISKSMSDDNICEVIENNPHVLGLLADFGAVMLEQLFESEEEK